MQLTVPEYVSLIILGLLLFLLGLQRQTYTIYGGTVSFKPWYVCLPMVVIGTLFIWLGFRPLLAELVGGSPATATVDPTSTATPSPGTPLTPRPTWLPELVEVPAGPFLMGSSEDDPLADSDEKPQHILDLPTYWIGKTPVTNAQFRPFVEGDGYTNPDYWTEVGWQWRSDADIRQPAHWNDPRFNEDTQPVVSISWFEAVAYTNWLSAQTGHPYRLPTEAEWEKAARGPDGRIYPWGNDWQPELVNSGERIGKTTPVGSYPDGASPYGALDMAGNVWEWTATQWRKDYPYLIEDEWTEAYLAGEKMRAVRGGAWYTLEAKYVRGAYRIYYYNPRDRGSLGLRLASHSSPP